MTPGIKIPNRYVRAQISGLRLANCKMKVETSCVRAPKRDTSHRNKTFGIPVPGAESGLGRNCEDQVLLSCRVHKKRGRALANNPMEKKRSFGLDAGIRRLETKKAGFPLSILTEVNKIFESTTNDRQQQNLVAEAVTMLTSRKGGLNALTQLRAKWARA